MFHNTYRHVSLLYTRRLLLVLQPASLEMFCMLSAAPFMLALSDVIGQAV